VNLWTDANCGDDIVDLQWRAQNCLSQSGAIPDPVAKILLERLGFGIEKNIFFDEKKRLQASQSCWLDRECLNFFQQYPEALVIECGAGYSSRFHRLSSALDWPRFRWLVADEETIIEKIQSVFPIIDNFSLRSWRDRSVWWNQWQSGPRLFLIEQNSIKMTVSEINQICHQLCRQSNNSRVPRVELHVFDQRFFRQSWLNRLKTCWTRSYPVACITVA
jgi:hypothetical protein